MNVSKYSSQGNTITKPHPPSSTCRFSISDRNVYLLCWPWQPLARSPLMYKNPAPLRGRQRFCACLPGVDLFVQGEQNNNKIFIFISYILYCKRIIHRSMSLCFAGGENSTLGILYSIFTWSNTTWKPERLITRFHHTCVLQCTQLKRLVRDCPILMGSYSVSVKPGQNGMHAP